MIIAAVMTASPPEEHAVLSVMLGPRKPYSMAMRPAAMFPITMGTKRGPTLCMVPVEILS